MKIGAARLSTLSLLLSGTLAVPVFSVQVSNVFNARLLGGQYFFQNEESSLSGNAGVTAAPAIGFNEQWSLIPTLSASWRGTKSVQDLVGGGTLFQQTQDHMANVKGVWKPNALWHVKAGGGYRIQMLKETKDERWGKGLFDFQKISANVELERAIGEQSSVRTGVDYYLIDFRNFSTLESQRRDLGRENASAKTLNTKNLGPYVAAKTSVPFLGGQRAKLDFSYFHTFRGFDEQNVVLVTGDLSPDRRSDKSGLFSATMTMPFVFSDAYKLVTDVRASYSRLYSNQNNYDAGKTRFNPNYYAYTDVSGGTEFNFLAGPKPWVYTAGFNYVRRDYSDRPVQDGNGTYGQDRIRVNEYYLNLGLTYPVNKNFRVQAVGSYGWSRSNMTYEKTYKYNYTTATYLAGVVFEY